MTDLAASDITVSIPVRDRDIVPAGPKLLSVAKITFGDAALTYPTGGIPLPAIGKFGCRKEIRAVFFCGTSTTGYTYQFDKTNHKLRAWTADGDGAAEASGAMAAQSIDMLIVGE